MNPSKISSLLLLTLLVFCFYSPSLIEAQDSQTEELLAFLKEESKPAEPLLPPDVEKVPGFAPGQGEPVGLIQRTQGTVLVIHQGEKKAYTLKRGMKVFKDDTFITETKSRMNLLLFDKSVLTLAAQSKLVLNKSFYDPDEDSRDTELQLLFGRVRCVVKEISTDPNYTVKTPTAVAGVRGTDFALKYGEYGSALITGEASTLTFKGPEGKTVIVSSNSVSAVLTILVEGSVTSDQTTDDVGTDAPMSENLEASEPIRVPSETIETVVQKPSGLITTSLPPWFD